MVPILGKPFLEHLIELLKKEGIQEIVLMLGYLPEKIMDYFGDGSRWGLTITYSVGGIPDETGTRVRNARTLLASRFLLLYADNYWPLDLKRMESWYEQKRVLATTTVYANRDGGAEYGRENNIYVDEAGMVRLYDKSRKDPRLNGVDIGFFILDRSVVDRIPEGNVSFEQQMLPILAAEEQLAAFTTDHPYYPVTSAAWLPKIEAFLAPKKVVFLDRDGVIARSMLPHEYVTTWDQFEFLPGAIEGLSLLQKRGYQIFIVTNQRGIGRGLMTEADLVAIHDHMTSELARHEVRIAAIYYCPHDLSDDCMCRKPKPGMLYRAAREHSLNLRESVFIGDSENDRIAAEAAGCRFLSMPTDSSLLEIVRAMRGAE